MFKDYIRTEGKRPIDKFKGDDSNLISYHTARKYDSYGGVLKPNILFLDIDTKEESEKLLKIIKELNINCNVLETTKGAHFYFERPKELEKNKIDWFSPIGITVTVKVGNKNVVEPLKIDGMNRKWVHKVENCDYLPKWLYPIDKNKNYVDRIEEGNRNQELFNLILKFQSAGLNKEEIKETIKVINKYVLKEPLPDFEIDTILRNDAFKKESFNLNGKFQFNKFGDYLISEYHVIQINNVLHIYKDGIYTDNIRAIETVMQNEIETLTITQRREILAYLQLKAPEKQFSSYKYIVVNNGVINIDNWELMPFTHHLVIKNKVLVDYMEGAYSPITDMTLNKIACRDEQLRTIFEEIFGYTLLRSNRYVKTILFTGNTRNGKSTLLKMMVNLIGNENTSSLRNVEKKKNSILDGWVRYSELVSNDEMKNENNKLKNSLIAMNEENQRLKNKVSDNVKSNMIGNYSYNELYGVLENKSLKSQIVGDDPFYGIEEKNSDGSVSLLSFTQHYLAEINTTINVSDYEEYDFKWYLIFKVFPFLSMFELVNFYNEDIPYEEPYYELSKLGKEFFSKAEVEKYKKTT